MMELRESVWIHSPKEQIWKFIADPALWPAWNEKIVAFERLRTGPVISGEQFGSRWRLSKREQPAQILVVSAIPQEMLLLRQLYDWKNRMRHFDIRFQITGNGPFKLTMTVDHSGTGIPLLLRALIWGIQRFGKPVGASGLDRLRLLAEAKETV